MTQDDTNCLEIMHKLFIAPLLLPFSKHKDELPLNLAADGVKCFVPPLLWLCGLSQEKLQKRRREERRREERSIVLPWLFLGSILAKAGTLCTEPHHGGEEEGRHFRYTWPMDVINTQGGRCTDTHIHAQTHITGPACV